MRTCLAVFVLFLLATAGCSGPGSKGETLALATTTSTRDTGLLDVLVPLFKERTGIEVKVVAVGSGQALELGRRGDADVLLAHAPEAEEKFMAEGYGEDRHPDVSNDFVLVGPRTDPAKVKGWAWSRRLSSGSPSRARCSSLVVTNRAPIRRRNSSGSAPRLSHGRVVCASWCGNGRGAPHGRQEGLVHSVRPGHLPCAAE